MRYIGIINIDSMYITRGKIYYEVCDSVGRRCIKDDLGGFFGIDILLRENYIKRIKVQDYIKLL